MGTSVIFLCPHNAAKSVAAAAYFGRAAQERGLDVTVTTGGTEPDGKVMPAVRAHLESDGFSVDSVPRLITAGDLAVDHVVNMGCDLAGLALAERIDDWSDVPMVSDGVDAAMAAIQRRCERFADQLAAGSPPGSK